MTDPGGRPAEVLAHAAAAQGFMPTDEGRALFDHATEVGSSGPDGPWLEVGSYCGKSACYLGAAAEAAGRQLFALDHHRGSEENQDGWEHHDPDLVDPVVVETVGVGQVEVDVASAADTVLVVVTPGMGDAVQANKAGLLEVADLFAVNKSDRPDAAAVRRDLELMLDLSDLTGHGRWRQDIRTDGWSRPAVVSTVATTGVGVDELANAIDAHVAGLDADGTLVARREGRWRAEVRSHVDHLLLEASRGVVSGLSAGMGAPAAVARELAAGLVGGPEGDR